MDSAASQSVPSNYYLRTKLMNRTPSIRIEQNICKPNRRVFHASKALKDSGDQQPNFFVQAATLDLAEKILKIDPAISSARMHRYSVIVHKSEFADWDDIEMRVITVMAKHLDWDSSDTYVELTRRVVDSNGVSTISELYDESEFDRLLPESAQHDIKPKGQDEKS